MSLCPPFHCSRCKFSHADECPPAVEAKRWPRGFVIEPRVPMETVGGSTGHYAIPTGCLVCGGPHPGKLYVCSNCCDPWTNELRGMVEKWKDGDRNFPRAERA